MKIRQDETVFKPVTITLHTRDEVYAFWGAIEGHQDEAARKMAIRISNWLTGNLHT